MPARHREEVLNTILAICLGAQGADADPETILRRGRQRPDVLATFRGLRCAIEGKVADTAAARAEVLTNASERIEQGIAHIAIAVVYPKELRTTEFPKLRAALNIAPLDFLVLTEAGYSAWRVGGIEEIFAELRRAHEVIVRDDVLQAAVDTLNIGLTEVADSLLDHSGTCDRLIALLGVGVKSEDAADSV
jgi:hypothetical protein